MKFLKSLILTIGVITSISTYNNAFCDDELVHAVHDNNLVELHINTQDINNLFTNVVNSFNELHQIINQSEQNNNVADLEYNYRFARYYNFRICLGPIRAYSLNLLMIANQQGTNTQQIEIFNNYLDAYDIFLMQRQMGNVEVQAPILNL